MQDFRFPTKTAHGSRRLEPAPVNGVDALRLHPNVMAIWAEPSAPDDRPRRADAHGVALRVIGEPASTLDRVIQVFNVLGGYIMGVVMMEVGAMFSGPRRASDRRTYAKMGDELRLP